MKLNSFQGRETRSQFWPYTALIVLLSIAALAIIMVPEMLASFDRMLKFAAEHPDQETVHKGKGQVSIKIQGFHPELLPDFSTVMRSIGILFLVNIVVLAAAVARRLHDSGKSGLWGLMPIPFIVLAMVGMPLVFDQFNSGDEPNLGLFFAVFANNLLYIGSLVLLVILLCGDSTPGDNRFGPVRAV